MATMATTTTRALLAVFIALSSSAAASPISAQLQKRRPVLNDSDTLSIDDKAPLDAILLIGVALFAALMCVILAILNVCVPNLSSSRTIREERARAKTELRLKGGGGATSPSPTRMLGGGEKKRSHQLSRAEVISLDLNNNYTANTSSNLGDSPKIAQSGGRPSRAARGYSTYSKYDISNMSRRELEPSLSMLAVPTLPTTYNNDSSSIQSLSSGSATTSPPPVPWHARPQYHDRAHSYGGHSRRISTTVGRGTDLNGNRSRKAMSRKIHVNPQAVDPAYSHQKLSPRASASDFNDPLSGLELKRYTTDPSDSREGSRRNSAMNALDFFNLSGNRGTYTDSASDSVGHETSGLSQVSSAAPIVGIPRTRNMAFYDAEQDFGHGSGHRQDASLLDDVGQSTIDSPRESNWRMWGKI